MLAGAVAVHFLGSGRLPTTLPIEKAGISVIFPLLCSSPVGVLYCMDERSHSFLHSSERVDNHKMYERVLHPDGSWVGGRITDVDYT